MTNLTKKLQFKSGTRCLLLNPPGDFPRQSLSDSVHLVDTADTPVTAVLLFAQNSSQLNLHLPTALKTLQPEGLLWIAYPKKSSGLETDLTRDQGWTAVFQAGFQPVRQIAIDGVWSALRFTPAQSDEELLASQYQGKKAQLRPIFDQIHQTILSLGADIEIVIRKGYVAYKRQKHFALIKASTQTRLDVGLKLRAAPENGRLQPAPGFGSGSITHKVALFSLENVDQDLRTWLLQAYNEAIP